MGNQRLVFATLVLSSLFLTAAAKRNIRPGFQKLFDKWVPVRDYHAAQFVDPDSISDCYANPGNYGVNIFNFTQKLDHFDSSNTATWPQQVQWKNTTFKSNPDGDIVFLLIGGEGPAPTSWMCFMNYTWTQLATSHNAFMFQLEHRYFGQSWPRPDMSVSNLKWLTTEQALADINAFIPAMNAKFKFNNPKWVAFGGSYPGTIAALLRVVYPNITLGNIASSAPLWPKVDFWEYSEKVEEDILWESTVNASFNGACYNETKAAFDYLRNGVYSQAIRDELNAVFGIQPQLGANMNTLSADVTYFLANIYFTFEGIIQYSFDDRSDSTKNRSAGLNVMNLCRYMVDTNYNYTERIYNVYAWTAAWGGYPPKPFDNDYWGDMSYFQNTSFLAPEASYRGWTWLTCNEFGWFQTTDKGYGIFEGLLPLSWFFQYCADMFDSSLTSDYIQNQVSATLSRYGFPWNYNGTNVVLPNGSLDPWSKLGCNVTNNSTHKMARTTIGGGHCVDMYPYKAGDPGSVEPNDVQNTINLVTQEVAFYLSPNNTQCYDQTSGCSQYLNQCSNPAYHNLLCNICKKTCNLCTSC